MSSSLGCGPPLFVKVNIFTLKKCPSAESCQGLRGAGERWETEGRKTFPSIQSAAIIHVECWNILPADPWCVLSWGLSWSQLYFQPVEESGVSQRQWAAESLWGDAGIQVLNAKLPTPVIHTDANTLCKHVSALEYVNSSSQTQTHSEHETRLKRQRGSVMFICSFRFLILDSARVGLHHSQVKMILIYLIPGLITAFR